MKREIIYLMKNFILLILLMSIFVTTSKSSDRIPVFENSQDKTFNVRGIRQGHKQHALLMLLFEKISSSIMAEKQIQLASQIDSKKNQHLELIDEKNQFKLEIKNEFISKRSKILKNHFLISPKSSTAIQDELFEVIQYIDPTTTVGHNSKNTSYLCRDSTGSILLLNFPYPIFLGDGDLLKIPPGWIEESGAFDYSKVGLPDLDASILGRQRVRLLKILDLDPNALHDLSLFNSRIKKIDEDIQTSTHKHEKDVLDLKENSKDQLTNKSLQKYFLSQLKTGRHFSVKLDKLKIDCSCAKGRVFQKKSSLQTELVSCFKCSGKGYSLNSLIFEVCWDNSSRPGLL